MSLQDAIQAKREYEEQFEQSRLITKAELIEVDGSVEVEGRPGWCWVREYGQTGGVYQVFNPSAQRRAGLPVLIGPEPKAPWRRRVLGVDWEMLPNMDGYRGSPYLPSHAPDHEWPDFKPGADAVSVYPRAIVPLRTYPASSGGLKVSVAPLRYVRDGILVASPGCIGADLSGYKPSSGEARLVLVCLDKASGEIELFAGDTTVDSPAVLPPVPFVPSGRIPSALVRLDGEQSSVREWDIIDVRQLLAEVGEASDAGGGGGAGAGDDSLPCCGA